MRFAAWCACWPLLGVLFVTAVAGDALAEAAEGLDGVINWLEDFADDRPLS